MTITDPWPELAVDELAAVRYRGWVLGWEDMTTEDAREAARVAQRMAHAGFCITAIDVVDIVVQLRSAHRSGWSPHGDGRDADPTSTTEVPPMFERSLVDDTVKLTMLDVDDDTTLADLKDQVDRLSRQGDHGPPIIVAGRQDELAALQREMQVGRKELEARRRRRELQRESRRRNRPGS